MKGSWSQPPCATAALAGLFLLLATAGCVHPGRSSPPEPVAAGAQDQPVAAKSPERRPEEVRPVDIKPATPPVAESPPAVEAPAARAEVPPAEAPAKAQAEPAPKKETATPAPAKPPAAPPLDLNALEKRLRDTEAIGVFTKLTLKNQVDDLLARFEAHHGGANRGSITDLRQPYDLLIIKVLSLLQDRDARLANDLVQSREAIWNILSDPAKFQRLVNENRS